MDMDQRTRTFGHGGAGSGHIILLGDGTEASSDSADSDMFDHDDEDKDLESQVHKGRSQGSEHDSAYASDNRSEREGTPAPGSAPSSNTEKSEPDEPKMMAATDSAIPPALAGGAKKE